jgi:carbon-monoxide dehydrogenase large subunit
VTLEQVDRTYTQTGWVGRSVRRKEDARLLRGEGEFIADMHRVGMLHAYFVRSKQAHARLAAVDLSKALEVPGVVAGYTGADLLEVGMRELLIDSLVPTMTGELRVPPSMPLAVDEVVFYGEPIAVLLAEDRYALEDAAELVHVSYEPLPVVIDPESALVEGTPKVFAHWPDNVLYRGTMGGDASQAFAEADVVIEERFEVPRSGATAMELRGVLTEWDDHRGLTHHTALQRPHLLQQAISQVFEWPEHMVRVIAPKDQGGSFGTKALLPREDFILALIAKNVKRPIRWIETREESFLAGVGQERGQIHYLQLAAKSDGTILGLRNRCIADLGDGSQAMYLGIGFPRLACFSIASTFSIPQVEIELVGVVTNKPCLTPSRPFGTFPVRFAVDRAVSMLAERLGMEVADVIRKNLISQFPHTSATGHFKDSGDYVGAFDILTETVNLPEFRIEQEQQRAAGRFIGIGFGHDPEMSGVSSKTYVPSQRKPGYGSAMVKVISSGKVQVFLGDPPSGQSHETAISQVLADEFGVAPEDVRLDYGDTLITPFALGNVGNRMASYTVNAAVVAARLLKQKMATVAAHDLGIDAAPDEFAFVGGEIIWEADPTRRISLAKIAQHLIEMPLNLPPGIEPGLEQTSYFEPKDVSNMTGSCLHAAIVEVDPETGEFKVLRYVVVDDCGKPINPLVVEGQIQGGVVQGIGSTVFEEFVYSERGELLTPTLEGYFLPSAADVPHVECHAHNVPTPHTPLGTKGKGEGTSAPVPGALANAVVDALSPFGIELNTLPLRPERIRGAVAKALHVTDPGEEPPVRSARVLPPGEGEGYELLEEMYGFLDGIQISLQPIWHPHIGQIRTWLNDYERSLGLAAERPDVLELLGGIFAGELEYGFDDLASPELTAEWQRLLDLPRPGGGHSYMDYINPALESHELLLIAFSQADPWAARPAE